MRPGHPTLMIGYSDLDFRGDVHGQREQRQIGIEPH